MDHSAEFQLFFQHWLEDIDAAGWLSSATAASRGTLESDLQPVQTISHEPPTATAEEASAFVSLLTRVLDEQGTAWMHRRHTAERDQLIASEHRDVLVTTARSLVEQTAAYTARLQQDLVTTTDTALFIAEFLTLLHGSRIAAIINRTHELVFWYENYVALTVIIQVERLRRDAPERQLVHDLRGELRRGRNRLTSALRNLVEDTRHFEHTHQRFTEQQLTALTTQRAHWQKAQQIAGTANEAAPTTEELALHRRYQRLAQRERELTTAIDTMSAERARLRQTARADETTAADRRTARQELAILWSALQEHQSDRRDVQAEKNNIRREMGRSTLARIQAYLEAESRGMRREDARQDRDMLLGRLDQQLGALTSYRLLVDNETGRWARYEQVLMNLLSSSSSVGMELFMDSYLKVSHLTERRRNIGLEANNNGAVQWLTYPGHGDNAVDWNCRAGLPLTLTAPTEFSIPERYQLSAEDLAIFQHDATVVTQQVSGSDDLQDIFGKIAYGLLGSSGSRTEPLTALLRDHGDSEIAPPQILARRFQASEMSRLLTGLAARNLTPIANVREFDSLRNGLLRDIEREVARREGVASASISYFNRVRTHADSGAFGLGRFIENISVTALLNHVVNMLTSDASSSYGEERVRLINRLWRLLLLMRSAGAEPHRRAISVTVRHQYSANATNTLLIDVYYTHLHRLAVRPSQTLRLGDPLGLTGSTGNAVNSHVHIEIRLFRTTMQIGNCLPHEFFPIP